VRRERKQDNQIIATLRKSTVPWRPQSCWERYVKSKKLEFKGERPTLEVSGVQIDVTRVAARMKQSTPYTDGD